MTIRVHFEPRDLWIGLYWKATPGRRYINPKHRQGANRGFSLGFPRTTLTEPVTRWEAWICLLPTLPIHLTFFRPREAKT